MKTGSRCLSQSLLQILSFSSWWLDKVAFMHLLLQFFFNLFFVSPILYSVLLLLFGSTSIFIVFWCPSLWVDKYKKWHLLVTPFFTPFQFLTLTISRIISVCLALHCFNCFLTLPVVHGSWSPWSAWSECDGCAGSSTRTRDCNSPPARFGGLPCLGESRQRRGCHDNFTICSGQHNKGLYINCGFMLKSNHVQLHRKGYWKKVRIIWGNEEWNLTSGEDVVRNEDRPLYLTLVVKPAR